MLETLHFLTRWVLNRYVMFINDYAKNGISGEVRLCGFYHLISTYFHIIFMNELMMPIGISSQKGNGIKWNLYTFRQRAFL